MKRTNAPFGCAAINRLRIVTASLILPLGLAPPAFAGNAPSENAYVVDALLPFVDNDSALNNWGRTVLLDGDRAIVAHGCPATPTPTVSCAFSGGPVEIWARSSDNLWKREALLPLPDGVSLTDEFGKAVALQGDIAVVGAPVAKTNNIFSSGRVFIYRRTSDGPAVAWQLVQTIDAIAPESAGRFGRGVALDGDRLIIGEPGAKLAGVAVGAAWVLTADANGVFGNATQLFVPNAASGDGWGTQVALVGDALVLGAPGRDVTVGSNVRADAGAFATFDVSDAPLFEGIVTSEAEASMNGGLGAQVRATRGTAGDILAVVAQREWNGFIFQAGAVRCYRRDASSWTPIGVIRGTKSAEALDQVALSNDLVAVGSPRWSDFQDVGRASLYAIRDGALVLAADVTGSDDDIVKGNDIGGAVALSGDSIAGTWLYRAEEADVLSANAWKIRSIAFGDIASDADNNGVLNGIEVTVNGDADCDTNLVPDADELAANDCDGSESLDACDLLPDVASSLNTGLVAYSGWGPVPTQSQFTTVLLARVEVPETSSGRLLSIGTRTTNVTSAPLVDAHMAVYRDPDGNKLPDGVELIEIAKVNVSLTSDEIRLNLSDAVDFLPGESIFIMLALKLQESGGSIFMTTHPGPYQLGWSFGGGLLDPDFETIGDLNLPEIGFAGQSVGNLFAVARFASPLDIDADGQIDTCACSGDLTGDGVVDAADLATLIGRWGGSGEGDLDGNGSVDSADLAALLGAWGAC